ncbi:hypothetical protein PIB30_101827, partial [Stylosanthes scabra]|nr:hypothetical protein [Stylosanthes scabra]
SSIWVKFCPKVRVHHYLLRKQLCWRKKAACAAPFAAWAASVVASEMLADVANLFKKTIRNNPTSVSDQVVSTIV